MLNNIPFYLLIVLLLFSGCDKNNDPVIFSYDQDKKLGEQVSDEIASNPDEYPVLDNAEYEQAYNYLENLWMEILNSGKVEYRDEFDWQIKLIHNDSVLNAFATPGGYVYVYTGLIKYLDEEDDLAGVLGHEVAHADLRHSIKNLQAQYGAQLLLDIITGDNPDQVTKIASELAKGAASLKFSRKFESQADDKSVEFLAETRYRCNGAYSFFQKLIDEDKTGNTPEFLSTHPDPEDRVADINTKADEIGCDTTALAPDSYQDFKDMLPVEG